MPTHTADVDRVRIISDAKTLEKVIKQTLIVSGYGLGDTFCECTKGFAGAWIIEMRFEVMRK